MCVCALFIISYSRTKLIDSIYCIPLCHEDRIGTMAVTMDGVGKETSNLERPTSHLLGYEKITTVGKGILHVYMNRIVLFYLMVELHW